MNSAAFRRRICATSVACLVVAACACLLNVAAHVARAQAEAKAVNITRAQSKTDTANARATWTPRLLASFEDYGGPQKSVGRGALVAFSPDGRLLALSDTKGNVKLYTATTGSLLQTLTTHHDWLNGFSFAPDSLTAATRDGQDRTVRLWNLSDGKELRELKGRGTDLETFFKMPQLPGEEFVAVPLSPDGKTVLAERKDDLLVMFDTATGAERGTLDHKTESNTAKSVLKAIFRGKTRELHMQANYSRDGRRIVTANGDDFPKLWDAEDLRLVATLSSDDGRVYNARFSPDSLTVATETWRGTVLLWDAATGQLKSALRAKEIDYSYFNSSKVYGTPSFAFSPDSRRVVTFRARDTQLWDVATGALVQTFDKSESHNAVFSPDSRLLATSGSDRFSARLWDAGVGRQIKDLPKAKKETDHVVFSPDGRILLTASAAGVLLWDAASGELLATLERARYPARFSPDSHLLATGGTGKTALLYELAAR
jgi:WD40 repeat protein